MWVRKAELLRLRFLGIDDRAEVFAMHFPGKFEAGLGKESGHEVSTTYGMFDHLPSRLGRAAGRRTDDERATDGGVVTGDLGFEAVLPPAKTLVGSEDDEGVFILAGIFEGLEEATDRLINGNDAFVVLLDPLPEGTTWKVLHTDGRLLPPVLFYRDAIFGHPMLHLLDVGRLAWTGWVNVFWDGYFRVFVRPDVPVGRE